MNDHLYRNSLFVMTSTFIVAVLGFFFWIVIARIFPAKDVGIATTLISSMSLLTTFSFLGFNSSLIRYLPKSTQRNDKVNSVFILVIAASIVSSVFFLIFTKLFSPHLLFLHTNIFYIISFILFVIGASLNSILDSIFIAYRAAINVLIKNITLSVLKLLFPVMFIFLGSYGIFSSVALATFISTLAGVGILVFKYSYSPLLRFNVDVIKQMASFSTGNYIAGFLSQIPTLILPLLIVNMISPEVAAYYYVASMILSFLTIIPTAATNAFLAEGSYASEDLVKHFFKSAKIIYGLLLPAIIVTFFFGNIILHVFGKSYASQADMYLRIVSLSAIFMSITYLCSTVLKIRHQITTLIIMNALGSILILGVCYMLLSHGLVGIGIGWLGGQMLLAIIYTLVIGKNAFPTLSRRFIVFAPAR